MTTGYRYSDYGVLRLALVLVHQLWVVLIFLMLPEERRKQIIVLKVYATKSQDWEFSNSKLTCPYRRTRITFTLLGARTLLGACGIATRSKRTLLGALLAVLLGARTLLV